MEEKANKDRKMDERKQEIKNKKKDRWKRIVFFLANLVVSFALCALVVCPLYLPVFLVNMFKRQIYSVCC